MRRRVGSVIIVIFVAATILLGQKHPVGLGGTNLAAPGPIGGTTPNTGIFTALSSDQIVDVAFYSGADWIAKLNAAITANGAVTYYVPGSLAGTATTVPVLAAGVTISFGPGQFKTTQTFSDTFANVHFKGMSGWTAQTPVSELQITTNLSLIGMTGAHGLEIDHLYLTYSNASYTANLIDLSGGGTTVSGNIFIHDDFIAGRSGSSNTAACLILANYVYAVKIENNEIWGGNVGVCGATVSLINANKVALKDNYFPGVSGGVSINTADISMGGTAWSSEGDVFEPLADGVTNAAIVTNTLGVNGFTIKNDWDSDGSAGAFFNASGGPAQGGSITGNYCHWSSAGTCLQLGGGSGVSNGIQVAGNYIGVPTAVDLGASNPAINVQIEPNYYLNNVTTVLAHGPLTGPYSIGATQAGFDNSTSVSSTAYADNNFKGVSVTGFREDFLGMTSTAPTTGGVAETGDAGAWRAQAIVASCTTATGAGTFLNPGQVSYTTTAISGDGCALLKGGSNGALGPLNASGGWEVNFIISIASTSSICIRAGVNQNFVADPPLNGMYVEYDTANTGNTDSKFTWVTASGSAYTYSTTNAIAADTSFHHFRIRSTVAGTVLFSVDGGTETAISTHIPANAMGVFVEVLTRTTATATATADFVSYMANTGRN